MKMMVREGDSLRKVWNGEECMTDTDHTDIQVLRLQANQYRERLTEMQAERDRLIDHCRAAEDFRAQWEANYHALEGERNELRELVREPMPAIDQTMTFVTTGKTRRNWYGWLDAARAALGEPTP